MKGHTGTENIRNKYVKNNVDIFFLFLITILFEIEYILGSRLKTNSDCALLLKPEEEIKKSYAC